MACGENGLWNSLRFKNNQPFERVKFKFRARTCEETSPLECAITVEVSGGLALIAMSRHYFNNFPIES